MAKENEDKKVRNLKRDHGEITQADRVLKAAASTQQKKTVKYRDFNGKKRQKEVLFTDPGGMAAAEAFNYTQAGNDSANTVALYQLLMDKVVTEPSLSFEKEDKTVTKSMKTKTASATNIDGKHVTLHFQFPDFRTAVSIANMLVRPSGAANFVQTLRTFDAYVIRDANGKPVSDDYWNAGHDGHGLIMIAMNKAGAYISSILNHDGFGSTMAEAANFLMGKVRQ